MSVPEQIGTESLRINETSKQKKRITKKGNSNKKNAEKHQKMAYEHQESYLKPQKTYYAPQHQQFYGYPYFNTEMAPGVPQSVVSHNKDNKNVNPIYSMIVNHRDVEYHEKIVREMVYESKSFSIDSELANQINLYSMRVDSILNSHCRRNRNQTDAAYPAQM